MKDILTNDVLIELANDARESDAYRVATLTIHLSTFLQKTWALSSVGQSARLLSERPLVQIQESPPLCSFALSTRMIDESHIILKRDIDYGCYKWLQINIRKSCGVEQWPARQPHKLEVVSSNLTSRNHQPFPLYREQNQEHYVPRSLTRLGKSG